MKVRAQRTHYMGSSNRDLQAFNVTTNQKAQSVFQRSFNKSKSLYSHQQNDQKKISSDKVIDGRVNPFLGAHNQFETSRFDKNQVKPYKYSKMVFPVGRRSITFAGTLNKQIKTIQQQFNGKVINLHKLKQLKHSFVKNNRDRRNLLPYFQTYAKNGVIDINGLKNIVKEYGFDINEDQANLIFKLTHHSNKSATDSKTLNVDEFVNLMTKDDVFYHTLQINNSKDKSVITFKKSFSDKVHEVLRNKFPNLKQAFKIYRQRGEQIGFKQFQYVMKKLDLTDLVLTQQQRMKIYKDYSDQKGAFNLEGLVCAIAAQQNQIKNSNIQQNDFSSDLKANQQIQFTKSGRSRHYNMKNLSFHQYENQYSKARTVIQQLTKLRNKNKDQKKDLNVYKNYFKDSYLNRQQVIKVTEKMLQKQGINFHKQDYEAFAAYLNYDVHGNISLDKINHEVFFQTEKQAKDRIQRRVRNLQPKKPNFIQTMEPFDSKTAIQSINKLKAHKMNPQTRELFKFFDKDQDGFIYENQFKQKLDSLKIMENWQIQNLAKYFKINEEGSINFRDFSKKVNQDLKILQSELPLVRSRNSKSCYDWTQTTKNKNSLVKNFNQSGYQKPTKFSAWPSNLTVQDLSLIQANPYAGMYASEAQRFNEKKQDYGRKQKMMSMEVAQNRRQRIAQWNTTLQQRAQINREKQQAREAAKNYALRLTKQKYELNCHQ